MTMSVFDISARAMSAQMLRLNTVASNMANMNSISSTEEGAYRPMRPVFETQFDDHMRKNGMATVDVSQIVQIDRSPTKSFRPDHPLANEEGFIFESSVNSDEEMVEMMEASRQYENTLEVVSTLRSLMARTMKMGQ